MPNPFLYIQFHFKQFSPVHVLFVYTHLNVKTVLFATIQFSISTQFQYKKKSVPYQTIQFRISSQFQRKKKFYFKYFSLA